jgi:hypothetical protein
MTKCYCVFVILALLVCPAFLLSGNANAEGNKISALGIEGRAVLEKPLSQSPSPDDPNLPMGIGDCTDYTDLTGQPLPIVVTGSTAGADNDYGPYPEQPACWQGGWVAESGQGPDVTYKWVAPIDTIYDISLVGSSYDTDLEIYAFTCPTEPVYPGDFICGNDDWGAMYSRLFISLEAGQQVLIVVDGYANAAGDYVLGISFADTSATPREECPENTIYGQSPNRPFDPLQLWTSDLHYPGPWLVYDDLPGDYQHVCGIEFWGFDWYFNGSAFIECVEDSMEFEVKLYEDDGSGLPGQEVWNGIITPRRTPVEYFNDLNRYVGEFDSCLTINPGWISIQGIGYGGDPDNCTFVWIGSQEGNDICWQFGYGHWYQRITSMSLCLLDSTATPIYENSPNLPAELSLSQNYPNPFNAQTIIQYSISKQAEVTIAIFDILGHKIETLTEGIKPAGNNQAIWDASGQSSGIYFYRIKAGDKVETKKMALMK